jgi:hypothetical protein
MSAKIVQLRPIERRLLKSLQLIIAKLDEPQSDLQISKGKKAQRP